MYLWRNLEYAISYCCHRNQLENHHVWHRRGHAAVKPAPPARTGIKLVAVLPIPSCPEELEFQAHTVPSNLRASEWPLPAETAITLLRPEDKPTRVGDFLIIAVPSPNCPLLFCPHAQTCPFGLSPLQAKLNQNGNHRRQEQHPPNLKPKEP